MKRCRTMDGFYVFQIDKDNKKYFLADKTTYQKEINGLINMLDDIKFDSVIFIYGLDTGLYLKELEKQLCIRNKVFIIEPNEKIRKNYKKKIPEMIKVLPFDMLVLQKVLEESIHERNFNNIYLYAFGNYKEVYKEEYEAFIKQLDTRIIDVSTSIGIANRFRNVFFQNMIANLEVIADSTPIHHYALTNLNVPAFVVSGGPSLDRNIEVLKKHKEVLKHSFIITGSRTVGALIKNDILPDIIASIDPIDANYDMMKDYLDLNVPLAFYENSNRYLLRDYKGEKMYIATLFPQILEEFKNLKGLYLGGSVAHSCIDLANMLGCSPIIFLGQDLAYTNNKHHASSAMHEYDKKLFYKPQIRVKDVFGHQINSTVTLDVFRQTLERYINAYHCTKRVNFINCSYGADIKGAPHVELEEVLKQNIFSKEKKSPAPKKTIRLSPESIIDTISVYIEECLEKAEKGIQICTTIIKEGKTKSLVELKKDDIDLNRFCYILEIIQEFEHSPNSKFLNGLMNKFLYDIKVKSFLMKAKDYEKLTSDLQYQARAFHSYFTDMKEMLQSAEKLLDETVNEFYK